MKNKTLKKIKSFSEHKKEYFAKNPQELEMYKKAIVDEYNNSNEISVEALTAALQEIIKLEGFSNVSKKTKLSRENLHRTFKNGNPKLSTLSTVAKFVGYKIALLPIH
jgi:DNA-binding phage protein